MEHVDFFHFIKFEKSIFFFFTFFESICIQKYCVQASQINSFHDFSLKKTKRVFLKTFFSNGLLDIFKTISEPILMKCKLHIVHINNHKMTYDRVQILIFTIFFFAKNCEENSFFLSAILLFIDKH